MAAKETEFWISCVTGTTGAGTASSPFRCPTAQLLDYVFSTELRENITWNFMSGSYQTGGITPRKGWVFKGSGMKDTTLSRVAGSPIVAAIYSDVRTDGVEVHDMTIDCGMGEAVRTIGSNILYRRITAINWGKSKLGETFVLAIGNNQIPGSYNYNPVIEECVVTQPANMIFDDGVTAISIHADGPVVSGLVRGGSIRNCIVYSITAGTGLIGSPLYLHAFSDGTGGSTHDNYVYDLVGGIGVYNDSWNGGDSVIENNVFDNVSIGIMFNMPHFHRTGVRIAGNTIRVGQGGIGIYWYSGGVGNVDPNGYGDEVVIMDNMVYPAAATTLSTALSTDCRRNVTILSNLFQSNGGQPDMQITGASYTNGNANFAGAI